MSNCFADGDSTTPWSSLGDIPAVSLTLPATSTFFFRPSDTPQLLARLASIPGLPGVTKGVTVVELDELAAVVAVLSAGANRDLRGA